MAEPKRYQFILDGKIANDFKTEINKIGGKIQDLSDAQVIVNFDENASMANFKKLYQKLEKENSDLTVQFRYDINKAMLEHARKELSNMEIYVDKSKAEQAIKELGQQLQALDIQIDAGGLDPVTENKLMDQCSQLAEKMGKIIQTHLSLNGHDLFKTLSDEIQFAFQAYMQLDQIKTIKPHIIDTKVLEAQRQQIEQITAAMEQLVAKGATDKIGTSNVDDSKIEEIKKDIAEVKEDITSLKGRVDTLEDTTAFDNLSSQVEEFDEKIKKTNDNLLQMKNTIGKLRTVGQTVTGMSKYGRTHEDSGELLAYSSSSTDYTSDMGISDSATGITKAFREEVYNRVKEEAEAINTQIHSHPDNEIAAASFDDIGVMIRQLEEGITKQAVVSLSQVMTFDFDSTGLGKDELKSKLVSVFEEYKKWVFQYFSAIDEKGNLHELAPLTNEMEANIVEYAKKLLQVFPNMDEDVLDSDVTQMLFQDKIKELFSKQGLNDVVKLSNLVDIESSFSFSDIQKVADSAFKALTSQTKKAIEEGYAEAQDSHSPSKEFEKLENDAVDGIVKGANDNSDKLKNVGKQMAQDVKDGFKKGMAEASTSLPSGEVRDADKIVETNENLEKSYEKVADAKRKVASKDNTPKLASKSVEDATPEITNMDKLEEAAEEAAQAKKDFATANEGVQDSVDDSKSKLELEAELMERLAKSAREAADAKKEFAEANQLVAQNEQTGDENAEDEAEKLFDTANLLKQLDNQYTRLFDTQEGKSNDYKQKLQELEEHISKIRNLGDVKESDTNAVNQIKEWDQAAQKIIKDLKEVKKYVLADSTAISKLSGDIADTLHKHTAMPKELAAQFEELQVRLSKSNMLNTELEEIRQAFVRLKSEMKITGSTGISMMDKLKRKYADVAVYFASYVSIYDFINVLKDGIQTIRDYDIGLTEMNKVSKENLATLKEFQQESFKLADSIGTTAKAIQSSTADFMRLGSPQKKLWTAPLYGNI